jgi:hypothetical protein
MENDDVIDAMLFQVKALLPTPVSSVVRSALVVSLEAYLSLYSVVRSALFVRPLPEEYALCSDAHRPASSKNPRQCIPNLGPVHVFPFPPTSVSFLTQTRHAHNQVGGL